MRQKYHGYCQRPATFDEDGYCNACGFHKDLTEPAEWSRPLGLIQAEKDFS